MLQGHLEVAEYLTTVNFRVRPYACYMAAKNGRLAALKWAMQSKQLDTNNLFDFASYQHNIYSTSFLHAAAQNNHADVAEFLLQNYVTQVDLLDGKKLTPLHCAASNNSVETMKVLISHGANVMAISSTLSQTTLGITFYLIPLLI